MMNQQQKRILSEWGKARVKDMTEVMRLLSEAGVRMSEMALRGRIDAYAANANARADAEELLRRGRIEDLRKKRSAVMKDWRANKAEVSE